MTQNTHIQIVPIRRNLECGLGIRFGFSDGFDIFVKVPTISVNSNIEIEVGGESDLCVTTQPSSQQVTFSSDDVDVATCENGIVTGLSNGMTTITAGFEYNGIPTNGENGNNGSTNSSENGSNGGSSSNSSSNSSTTGTLGEKAQSFGQKAMSALKKGWNISVNSFKEGYHSVPDYNTYNFDDRFLFYEGTQNQNVVLHIIDLLIEDSDNNLFSKPTLKLKNFGGDRTIEYTTPEEYKSALQDARGTVTNGNYDVSFGYSALHVYVDEIIITK